MLTAEFIATLRLLYLDLLPAIDIFFHERYHILKGLRTAQSIDEALGIYYAAIREDIVIDRKITCLFFNYLSDEEIYTIYSDALLRAFEMTFSSRMLELDEGEYNSFYYQIPNAVELIMPQILAEVKAKIVTNEVCLYDIHLELLDKIIVALASSTTMFMESEKNFFPLLEDNLSNIFVEIQDVFYNVILVVEDFNVLHSNLALLDSKPIIEIYSLVRRCNEIATSIMPPWHAIKIGENPSTWEVASMIERTVPANYVNSFASELEIYLRTNDLMLTKADSFLMDWIVRLEQHANQSSHRSKLPFEQRVELRNANVLLQLEFESALSRCAKEYANNHLFSFVTNYRNGAWRQCEGLISGMEWTLNILQNDFKKCVHNDPRMYKIFAWPNNAPIKANTPSPDLKM